MGNSYTPGLFRWPARQNRRVPPFLGVPIFAYQSAPPRIIGGTLASVSALLMTVGPPQSPTTAGKGGRMRGMPRLPSSDSISADSSPTSYAPAPPCQYTSNLRPLPKMLAPRNP